MLLLLPLGKLILDVFWYWSHDYFLGPLNCFPVNTVKSSTDTIIIRWELTINLNTLKHYSKIRHITDKYTKHYNDMQNSDSIKVKYTILHSPYLVFTCYGWYSNSLLQLADAKWSWTTTALHNLWGMFWTLVSLQYVKWKNMEQWIFSCHFTTAIHGIKVRVLLSC
jgi:hypothetical protein